MEPLVLEEDINVFGITVKSYPDGVLYAHQELHAIVPHSPDRSYFYISQSDGNGGLIYIVAAIELWEGELRNPDLQSFVIPKGKYLSVVLTDYHQNASKVKEALHDLAAYPGVDPDGIGLEWHLEANECKCLVKMLD